MKTFLLYVLATLSMAAARSPLAASADLQSPIDSNWSVKEIQASRVPIGGIGYLSVTIERKKFDKKVTLEVRDLPSGISVREKEIILDAGDTSAKFTLVASTNLQQGTLTGGKVVAQADTSKSAPFAVEVKDYTLQAGSGAVMTISILAVLCLTFYCIWRVFTLPPVEVEEHIKGPLEIDTRDTKDAD